MNDNDGQLRDEYQRQQRQQQQEDNSLLSSERKARGELRNSHLEAGREQARSDQARAKERNTGEPHSVEDTGDGDTDGDYETKRSAQKGSRSG
jgi:hypothetical protein